MMDRSYWMWGAGLGIHRGPWPKSGCIDKLKAQRWALALTWSFMRSGGWAVGGGGLGPWQRSQGSALGVFSSWQTFISISHGWRGRGGSWLVWSTPSLAPLAISINWSGWRWGFLAWRLWFRRFFVKWLGSGIVSGPLGPLLNQWREAGFFITSPAYHRHLLVVVARQNIFSVCLGNGGEEPWIGGYVLWARGYAATVYALLSLVN